MKNKEKVCVDCRKKDERMHDLVLVVARQNEEILRLTGMLGVVKQAQDVEATTR